MATGNAMDPTVEAAINALQTGDKIAWRFLFATNAKLFDDGKPRDLITFTNEVLGHERFTRIESVGNDGLSVVGRFHSGQWGDFRAYFKFQLRRTVKSFGSMSVRQNGAPLHEDDDRPYHWLDSRGWVCIHCEGSWTKHPRGYYRIPFGMVGRVCRRYHQRRAGWLLDHGGDHDPPFSLRCSGWCCIFGCSPAALSMIKQNEKMPTEIERMNRIPFSIKQGMRVEQRRASRPSVQVLITSLLLVCTSAFGQTAIQLSAEDARLNHLYQQRITQLHTESTKLADFRGQERNWIRQRNQICGKNIICLTKTTKERADLLEEEVSRDMAPQKLVNPIPRMLWGKWIIRRVLPSQTISCWDQKQAEALINTEIEYGPESLRWKNITSDNQGSETTLVMAKQFAQDNSGSGSTVSFEQLGITARAVQQIAIQHPDVSAAGGSEMPGETVLLKNTDTIIFSLCNIYFEAAREK